MNPPPSDEVLRELGDLLGLHGLRLDGAGCCQLCIDARWVITLAAGGRSGGWTLHCPLASPAQTASLPGAVLLEMLAANFGGRAPAALSFSVGPDRRACVQQDVPAAQASASALQAGLGNVLAAAQSWVARLDAAASSYAFTAEKPRKLPLSDAARMARRA